VSDEKSSEQRLESKAWDYENGFYWFSHPTRLAKALAHYELYKKVLEIPGEIVEFGVFKGTSLIRWATFRHILENDFARTIIGFDVFGKFPTSEKNTSADSKFIEEWSAHAGDGIDMAQIQQLLKEKNFSNIELIKGDIFQTLDPYLDAHPSLKISLLHLDLDVFAPTEYVINRLYTHMSAGALIILDDYGVVEGATLAVDEFVKRNKLRIQKNYFYKVPSFIEIPNN